MGRTLCRFFECSVSVTITKQNFIYTEDEIALLNCERHEVGSNISSNVVALPVSALPSISTISIVDFRFCTSKIDNVANDRDIRIRQDYLSSQ